MTDKKISVTREFDGCDGGDPGSPEAPTVWLFGIEHGTYKSRHDANFHTARDDPNYSIQTQLKWPYNQKAFKLLAAMEGKEVARYREFAEDNQPFVNQSKGYFKGNLYPFACRNISEWPAEAEKETGLTKLEYREWCKEHHLPAIKKWIDKYQPKIFIGIGTTSKSEFVSAAFGADIELNVYQFSVNGHVKQIFHAKAMGRRLVIVPHLSGSRYGLNSNESLRIAGEFIADFIDD
jgi:hypothetical protein